MMVEAAVGSLARRGRHVALPTIAQNCAIAIHARHNNGPRPFAIRAAQLYQRQGTAMEQRIMRQLIRVLAAFSLAVVPLAAASAQSRLQSSPLLNLAPPPPTINPLPGRIPAPLAAPSPAPAINGPLSDPLSAEPAAPGAPPSVFGSSRVPFRLPIAVVGFQMGPP
jgi:hypothetical protein